MLRAPLSSVILEDRGQVNWPWLGLSRQFQQFSKTYMLLSSKTRKLSYDQALVISEPLSQALQPECELLLTQALDINLFNLQFERVFRLRLWAGQPKTGFGDEQAFKGDTRRKWRADCWCRVPGRLSCGSLPTQDYLQSDSCWRSLKLHLNS